MMNKISGQMIIVEKSQLINLNHNEIDINEVGQKAYGLLQIPQSWTPAFFVISKKLLEDYISTEKENRENIIDEYLPNIFIAIQQCNLNCMSHIIFRSSGLVEGMNERGKFDSIVTTHKEIKQKLCELLDALITITSKNMPIVVQGYIEAKTTGHMSNERRFSFDIRDWKIEYYYDNNDFEQDTVCIRKWRKTYNIDEITSHSLSSVNIKKELSKVAYFWHNLGEKFGDRFHLEFVYDDENLYIVQADKEITNEKSVNPMAVDITIHSKVGNNTFNILKEFNPKNKCEFKKLDNVHTYATLGLVTVPLYILDNESVIEQIKSGIISESLKNDLEKLLSIQSVVVRTDVIASKGTDGQLLPRSNEIKNFIELKNWLIKNSNQFSSDKKIAFIFHNFVPSIASAFAHATPNNRIVEIQSLWGLPEGLYYNAHDTVIVTLPSKSLDLINPEDLQIHIKRNYKDAFVTPSNDGEWQVKQISSPYDWKCSVNNESIFHIAINSQKITNHEKKEISVMWFVGIDENYYGGNCLAWYHEEYCASYTPDDYKRKRFVDEEFTVHCIEDLNSLEENFENICCLRIKPTSDEDLRSKDFIKKVGEFAHKHNINILLEGAQLTHTYYQLKSTNAVVVCSSKSELGSTYNTEFNKLVRDLIPEKIISNGEIVSCFKAENTLFDRLLLEKLLEESFEAYDADDEKSFLEELADIYEICSAIKDRAKISNISTIDIRNNAHNEYILSTERLLTNELSLENFQQKSCIFNDKYIYLKIHRQKTSFRIELDVSNIPLHQVNDIETKSERICKNIVVSIIRCAMCALKEKESDNIIKNIDNIEKSIKSCCDSLKYDFSVITDICNKKNEKNGAFNNGYILLKTKLASRKDKTPNNSFLDDLDNDFDTNNIVSVSSIDFITNKYYDCLQRDNDGIISVFRFNVPIGINSWKIVFENESFKKLFSDIEKITFSFNKNKEGFLTLNIDAILESGFEQISFY